MQALKIQGIKMQALLIQCIIFFQLVQFHMLFCFKDICHQFSSIEKKEVLGNAVTLSHKDTCCIPLNMY